MSAPRALAALLLLLAGGCAALGPGAAGERALAPASAIADRSFQQVLTFRRGDVVRRLIAAGEVRDGRLVLALLTPEGLEVLRVRQVGTRLRVLRDDGLPPGLTARAILADFQLVHWPAESLEKAWAGEWRLTVADERRVASLRGEPRVRVDYTDGPWGGPVVVDHPRLGYRLRVETLAHEMLTPSVETSE